MLLSWEIKDAYHLHPNATTPSKNIAGLMEGLLTIIVAEQTSPNMPWYVNRQADGESNPFYHYPLEN